MLAGKQVRGRVLFDGGGVVMGGWNCGCGCVCWLCCGLLFCDEVLAGDLHAFFFYICAVFLGTLQVLQDSGMDMSAYELSHVTYFPNLLFQAIHAHLGL